MTSSQASLRPSSGVVAREMNGSAVLVHLGTNRIYELNETGARVWAMLEGGLDRPAITERLSQEFGVPATEAERAIEDFLAHLKREGLVGS